MSSALLRSPALAVLAAFLVRAILGWGLGTSIAPGINGGEVQRGFEFYGLMADGLLSGEGMSWVFYEGLGEKFANRAPLFPALIAAVRAVAGTPGIVACILVQAAVGAAGCLVPWALARRWRDERAGLWAVWCAALWPYWALVDTAMVEHVVFTPLVGLSVLFVAQARDDDRTRPVLLAGVFSGLVCLARLTFGLALPFLALALLRSRAGFRGAALYTVVVCAVLAPWVVRNHDVVGKYTVGTDGGRALWLGSHPSLFDYYPERSVDRSEQVILRAIPAEDRAELMAVREDEVLQAAVFQRWAVDRCRSAPGEVAWGALRKSSALFSPVYNPLQFSSRAKDAARVLVFAGSLLAALIAFAAGLIRTPTVRRDLPVVLSVALGFTLSAALFWGQSRYLAPLHGVGIAAIGVWIAQRTRSASRRGRP